MALHIGTILTEFSAALTTSVPSLRFVPPSKNVVGWALWVFGLRQCAPKICHFAGDS